MKNKKKIFIFISILILALLVPTNVEAVSVKKIKISTSRVTLTKGSSKTITIKNTKKKVKWSSNKKNVATVNSNGKITAKSVGKATVTGKVDGKSFKCTVKVKNKSKELQALDIINNKRKKNGLNTLTWNKNLVKYAKIRAKEASKCWSHTRPNGTPWYTVSDKIHGENLAKNYSTAKDVVKAWTASQGHKENILRRNFKKTAIATYTTPDGITYWCQVFAY